jgi:integrase
VKKFIDRRDRVDSPPFRVYAEPFHVWPSCPRVTRLLAENKQIGKTHVEDMRRLMNKYVFLDTAFCSLRMADIRRGHVLDFRSRLLEQIGACNTLNRVMSAIKTILSEAYFRGDSDVNAGDKIGNINYEAETRDVFTLDEMRLLFANRPGVWPSALFHDFFKVMAFTGMRNGEVSALSWEQIEGKDLHINRAFKHDATLGAPKWDKSRSIVIPDGLSGVLSGLGSGLIFKQPGNKRVGPRSCSVAFSAALQIAGINRPGLTAYSFRHSLNSHLLAAGADPFLVQCWMGWSSRIPFSKVQTGYTHLQVFDLGKVARLIDSLYSPRARRQTG